MGSGLGLSIVLEASNAMGATIKFRKVQEPYFIVFLILNFHSTLALGLNIEAERNYGSIKNNPDLQILSSTDIEVFDPVLKAFKN